MKKDLLILSIFLFVCSFSFPKPVFKSSKYIIACQFDNALGGVIPGAGEYKMTYNPDLDGETAPDSAFWIIKEQTEGVYSFQNAASKKYIKHLFTGLKDDRWALKLVDSLQTDNSTSFTLELHQSGNQSYYSIRSVINPSKIWERRELAHLDAITKKDVFAVGVIGVGSSSIRNFIFYDSEGISVKDIVPIGLPAARPTLGSFATFMDSLTFAGKFPAVDKIGARFYLSVLESELGSNVTMKLNYKPKVSTYEIYIDGEKIISGANYTFKSVSGTKTYNMQVRQSSSILSSGTIHFSCLPFVQIYSDAELNTVYNLGRIVVTEPSNFTPSEVLLSEFRTRGFYAGRQPKKSLAIKLKETDGVTPLDRSFYGLRNDNNWVLDAMYNDSCRMKNRVSTDFWLDFSTRPYYADQEPNMVNGTRGHFVEVFLNDSYNGLYCMTEKIDRRQMNVKKLIAATPTTPVIQRGAVIKADDWSEATLFGFELDYTSSFSAPEPNSESWYAFNVKYPDVGDGEPFNWQTLCDAVNVVTYASSPQVFESEVVKYFDMPVFRDYYLFLDLLLLTDNHGKNFFVSTYDQTVSPKITLTPWDLDSSWGRFWDGTSGDRMRPDQTLEDFISRYVPRQSTLYKRLMETNVWGFNDKLKTRYRELRGTWFDHDLIMERFQKYNALFQKSGAGNREMARWEFATMNSDLAFISNWLQARLAFLDNQYLGGPYIKDATQELNSPQISVYPNPVQDVLTVSPIQSGDLVQIFSAQGMLISQARSTGEKLEVDLSSIVSGIYMVKVGGMVVKILKK